MRKKILIAFPQEDGSVKKFNNGKPFCVPHWTTQKHKAALAQLVKESDDKKLSKEEENDLFNYYVILQTLRQIDNTVTVEDIQTLHPEDLIELFSVIYNAGKQGIYFQQPKKTGKKK